MITVELARRLGAAGVLWEPAPGDRFTIDQPNDAGEVFWISHLTIDDHTFQCQPLIGFNGTTEWDLDSVTLDTALWLPREDQLRVLIGDRFDGLRRDGDAWVIEVHDDRGRGEFRDPDVECAYAQALLSFT